MSILIPGMKMPKNGVLVLKIDTKGNVCTTARNDFKKYKAIELPPHGRLGDLDALSKSLDKLCDRICEYSKAQRKVMCGSCPLGDDFAVVEDDALTIIPEDQKDGDSQ